MELNRKNILRILLIIFASIVFYTVLQNTGLVSGWISFIGQVLSPIFIGIIIAFIINLPLRMYENKVFARLNRRKGKVWTKIRRPLCLFLSVLTVLGIIALIIGLIIPEVKNTAVAMFQSLPGQVENFIDGAKGWMERLSLPVDISVVFEEIDWNSISKNILSGISDTGGTVLVTTIDFTSELVGGVFNFVVGFTLSLYILGSKEKLAVNFKRVLRAALPSKACDRFMHVMSLAGNMFTGFVTGQLTEAVLIGLWCYLGMTIFGMPYAIVVSAVIAVTALVPVFGALVGTLFGAFMLLLESPLMALGFVIYIIVIQQIDSNVIYPRIVGSSVGLPGIWVICAVTVGGSLFGAVGMLLAVPVWAVIYSLIKEFVCKKEAADGQADVETPVGE